MAGDRVRVRLRRVAKIGFLVVPATGLEVVFAPTIASLLHMGVFHAFSALVIMTVGTAIANDRLGERLVAPRWLVLLGMVSSVIANLLLPGAITPVVVFRPWLVLRAMSAASTAVLLATVVAIAGPTLDEWLALDRFRVGSGISLALVPLNIVGVLPGLASLAVFLLAIVFSLDL